MIFQDIGNAYANAAAPWLAALFPIAQRLFFLLATVELIWSGIWWAIEARRGQEDHVLVSILRKTMTILFFYTLLLLAPTWIPMIVGSFIRAGQVASGFPSLDPGTVIAQGIDVALALIAESASPLSILYLPFWLIVTPITVVFSFAVIAGTLLVTLVESYLVLGGGVLLLGFTGSRWTVSFSEGQLVYAVQVGVRLFVIYLLIGVGMSLPATWIEALQDANPLDPRVHLEILGGSLIFSMIVRQVPQLATKMLGQRGHFRMDQAYGE